MHRARPRALRSEPLLCDEQKATFRFLVQARVCTDEANCDGEHEVTPTPHRESCHMLSTFFSSSLTKFPFQKGAKAIGKGRRSIGFALEVDKNVREAKGYLEEPSE